VEAAFAGHAVSRVLEGQAAYDLVVRYSPEVLASFDTVAQTLTTTAAGARLPLSAVAEVRRDGGPNIISRENEQRKIAVLAKLPGPMAVVVLFGPAGSTFLDTIVVPALYLHFGGLRKASPRAPSEGKKHGGCHRP
jgi:Cu/Ag efflux pump CusA